MTPSGGEPTEPAAVGEAEAEAPSGQRQDQRLFQINQLQNVLKGELEPGQMVNPLPGAAAPSGAGLFGAGRDPATATYDPDVNARMHQGIDLNGDIGAPIYAAAAGRVIQVGVLSPGAGRGVVIDHGNGYTTHYFHTSSEWVEVGMIVQAGEAIAGVGQTGNAAAPHLHFEIRYQGAALDPLALQYVIGDQPEMLVSGSQGSEPSPGDATADAIRGG